MCILGRVKPRIVIITNEIMDGDSAGQVNGYVLLVESGELESVKVFSHRNQARPSDFRLIVEELQKGSHDFLVIFSPGHFPSNELEFQELMSANNDRPIVYWEGDAWGLGNVPFLAGRKSVTKQMKWWLAESAVVFTHSGNPQISEFSSYGAKTVSYMPQTYCHIKFSEAEMLAPENNYSYDGILIGSNLSRVPGFTGLPGSASRMKLAYKLKSKHGSRFKIYGKNWLPFSSEGTIPYSSQSEVIRNSRISVNWDHFPNYENYTSDRFPISLLSGRPHLTTLHPKSFPLPDEETGVFLAESVNAAIEKYQEILDLGDKRIFELGYEAWKWSRYRLSHRVAARFIMSTVTPDVKKVNFEPWLSIR